jgi:hypothetical protein|tara:strand:- start:139 stop:531 length:393 start_codon:yes stop_codon:yes gene_type:complete
MNSTQHNGFTEAWERSKPFLANALEQSGNEYTVDDVLREIEDDHAIFYPTKKGASVFRIALYPRKRMLRIWLAGGDMESSIESILEAADFHAKEHECDGIEVLGRRGWEKVLKPYGYEHKRVMLIKELGD